MAELPETARQKLKHWVAGPHPDANLLAAFAENSLSARERKPLVEHLAACAACREVVALAAPQDVPAPVAAAPGRMVRQWAMLRWGTAAAILVVMVGVVWIGRTTKTAAPNSAAEMARATPEPQSEPAPVEKQKEGTPSAGAAADDARLPAMQDKVEAARPRVAKEAPPAPPAEAKAQPPVSGLAGAESASKKMAAVEPSKDRKLDEVQVQAGNGVQEQKGELRAEIAQAAPAPPSAMKSAMARRPAAQAGVEAQANAPAAAAADSVTGGLSGVGSAQGAAREALPAPGRAQAAKVAAAKTAPRWSISANGDLQRSLDDGVTWQDEPLAAKAVFRAVSVIGGEIWAGGNGGVLYHSSDGGGSWTRVTPAAAGVSVTGDIVRINFADAQRGSLTTSSGQTWLTTDGGRSWARR